MKDSFKIISFFIIGVVLGIFCTPSLFIVSENITAYFLYLLLFLIGINVGSDEKAKEIIKSINIKTVFLPISIIFGTFLGVGIFSFLIPNLKFTEALAVGSGFGYYSLSSILITKISGEALGVIALLSNIMREIITLLASPLLARYFGKLAPIASGGATSMDTTLPIIIKSAGKEYVILAVFSGLILTILVPFFVSFILKF